MGTTKSISPVYTDTDRNKAIQARLVNEAKARQKARRAKRIRDEVNSAKRESSLAEQTYLKLRKNPEEYKRLAEQQNEQIKSLSNLNTQQKTEERRARLSPSPSLQQQNEQALDTLKSTKTKIQEPIERKPLTPEETVIALRYAEQVLPMSEGLRAKTERDIKEARAKVTERTKATIRLPVYGGTAEVSGYVNPLLRNPKLATAKTLDLTKGSVAAGARVGLITGAGNLNIDYDIVQKLDEQRRRKEPVLNLNVIPKEWLYKYGGKGKSSGSFERGTERSKSFGITIEDIKKMPAPTTEQSKEIKISINRYQRNRLQYALGEMQPDKFVYSDVDYYRSTMADEPSIIKRADRALDAFYSGGIESNNFFFTAAGTAVGVTKTVIKTYLTNDPFTASYKLTEGTVLFALDPVGSLRSTTVQGKLGELTGALIGGQVSSRALNIPIKTTAFIGKFSAKVKKAYINYRFNRKNNAWATENTAKYWTMDKAQNLGIDTKVLESVVRPKDIVYSKQTTLAQYGKTAEIARINPTQKIQTKPTERIVYTESGKPVQAWASDRNYFMKDKNIIKYEFTESLKSYIDFKPPVIESPTYNFKVGNFEVSAIPKVEVINFIDSRGNVQYKIGLEQLKPRVVEQAKPPTPSAYTRGSQPKKLYTESGVPIETWSKPKPESQLSFNIIDINKLSQKATYKAPSVSATKSQIGGYDFGDTPLFAADPLSASVLTIRSGLKQLEGTRPVRNLIIDVEAAFDVLSNPPKVGGLPKTKTAPFPIVLPPEPKVNIDSASSIEQDLDDGLVIKFYPKVTISPLQDQTIKPETKEETKQRERYIFIPSTPGAREGEGDKSKSKTDQDIASKITPIVFPDLNTVTIPKIDLVNVTRPEPIQETKLAPPLLRSPEEEEKKGRRMRKGYNTYVKERGRFKRVNKKPLPYNRAVNLGINVADNTPVRTTKVIRSKKKTKLNDTIQTPNINKFNKIKKNTWREKNKYNIDTAGELNGITVKGWLARRNTFGRTF